MGVDFLQRAGETLRRTWDQGRVKAAAQDMLTREPTCAGRSIAADLEPSIHLSIGETVTVQMEGSFMIFRRGIDIIARVASPPPALVALVATSYNIRHATIEEIHAMAKIVEINIC